mmetsp:Transcript_18371/g.46629  ORF Transcript_18371/g.46629 Transcript_18371/m.46629 type:complete len:369 (+) Transcript_18371:87-1193(+)
MRYSEKGGFIKSISRRRPLNQKKSVAVAPSAMAGMDSWKVGGIVTLLFVFFFYSSNLVVPAPDAVQGSLRASSRCETVWCLSNKQEFHFAIVADLDRQSKVKEAKKPTWRSIFQRATLSRGTDQTWTITWGDDTELKTQLGEAGRGLELSELVQWEDRLWTFDDRSGVVFELDRDLQCIPRFILMEGDGNNSKGQKTEWATEKDGRLYVGSFGKPYTNNLGEVTTRNNLWISIIDPSGRVTHEDWTKYYEKMQQVTNSVFPGYMIHEAIHWDGLHRLWYVLPRRVSSEPYDEKLDESMGSNLVLAFNEDFTSLEHRQEIGAKVPTHGWSSFKFVPWTNNEVIIALRTMEIEDKVTGDATQKTFLTVFM